MKLYTYDPMKKRNVHCGDYSPEKQTFIKKVSSRHYMFIEKGYGISEEILLRLCELKCLSICIKTKNSEFISKLSDWLNCPIKNYGHGFQRFLRSEK